MVLRPLTKREEEIAGGGCGGEGIEASICREVAGADGFGAIDVESKAVVVADLEEEAREVRGVGNVDLVAEVGGGISLVIRGNWVSIDELDIGAESAFTVAELSGSAGPGAVIV